MNRSILTLLVSLVLTAGSALAKPAQFIAESAREVPLVAQVDVVIVGASSGAVSAAVAAAKGGASVYLIAPYTYLGEDIGGTMRLYIEKGEVPESELGKAIFASKESNTASSEEFTRVIPLHVKKTLDQALLDAGVKFVYSSYPTDVLRDAQGRVAGVVVANRSGRQAFAAKTVIDATPQAVVARLAGAKFSPYQAGEQKFTRIVIGAPVKSGKGIVSSREITPPYTAFTRYMRANKQEIPSKDTTYRTIEYVLSIPMADGGFKSFANAEQVARDLTYSPKLECESEMLFQVPPDQAKGVKSVTGPWAGAAKLDLDAFRPAGVDGLYILGGCADISREQAAKLLRPLALIDIGERIGEQAAKAGKVSADKLSVMGGAPSGEELGEVRETLVGLRSVEPKLPTVPQPQRGLPILGEYDVVVVGGGTGGAPAGIAAARKGARTLVIEYQYALGGVGTVGMIFSYHSGNRVGFAEEVGEKSGDKRQSEWKGPVREEWWRSEIRKAGGEVWFGVIGCGAVVKDGRAVGVVVSTPQGRGVVLGKVIVDSTGNSDIAIAAGADYEYIDSLQFAMQDAGISYRALPWHHFNSGYTIVDEADAVDVTHDYVFSRARLNLAFDLGTFFNTRERRRIVGDYSLTVADVMAQRIFPDTVVQVRSNLDTHGYIIDPYWNLATPERSGVPFTGNLPYRCLLPKGVENMFVTGLGISAHRDAMPFARMMPDIHNQGYAVGIAAAMAVKEKVSLRKLNVRALQQQLVQIGNLTPNVLGAKDSFPVSDERLAKAIQDMPGSMLACGIVVGAGEKAIAPLQAAYAKSSGKAKLLCAIALAMQGDNTGRDLLIQYLESKPWDLGWGFRRRGEKEGAWISEMDGVVRALAILGDPKALPAIRDKAKQLDPNGAYSHYHSIAYAMAVMPAQENADVLHSLLSQPGLGGWSTDSIEQDFAKQNSKDLPKQVVLREASPREVMLAAALFRCGDKDGLGRKTLEAYAKDLRGLYVRFATMVLADKK